MAIYTVRGNKTTKELKKGVSIMKKSCFKVLCMVLIIALLAPNAFAATPTPEAPLADAATVERVKQEIADGEITDMEDLFLVAYQHLGADLEEEGMTAYINEDGTLGITQIISSEKKMTRSGEVEEFTFATSILALVDEDGAIVMSDGYTPYPDYANEDVAGISIFHTAYYNGKITNEGLGYLQWVQLSHMVTTINGASASNYVTRLEQKYEFVDDYLICEPATQVRTNLVSGSYSFTPAARTWGLRLFGGYDAIITYATVYVSGVSDPVVLQTIYNLDHEGEDEYPWN